MEKFKVSIPQCQMLDWAKKMKEDDLFLITIDAKDGSVDLAIGKRGGKVADAEPVAGVRETIDWGGGVRI